MMGDNALQGTCEKEEAPKAAQEIPGPRPLAVAGVPEEPPISHTAAEALRALLLGFFKVLYRLRYSGQGNIPASGPVIVAPNHVTYLDPLIVGMGIKRRLRSMAWDALFRVPVLGPAIRWLGAFPVRPDSHDSDAYKQCLAILARGGIVQIYPEGRRGDGQDLCPFEQGVARPALRTGAAIVPVSLCGIFEAWPRWKKWPRPRWGVAVKFHPPVRPPVGRLRGAELQRAIDELNEQIARPIRRRCAAYRRLMRRRGRHLPTPPPGDAPR